MLHFILIYIVMMQLGYAIEQTVVVIGGEVDTQLAGLAKEFPPRGWKPTENAGSERCWKNEQGPPEENGNKYEHSKHSRTNTTYSSWRTEANPESCACSGYRKNSLEVMIGITKSLFALHFWAVNELIYFIEAAIETYNNNNNNNNNNNRTYRTYRT
jgi:hypothetical protein